VERPPFAPLRLAPGPLLGRHEELGVKPDVDDRVYKAARQIGAGETSAARTARIARIARGRDRDRGEHSEERQGQEEDEIADEHEDDPELEEEGRDRGCALLEGLPCSFEGGAQAPVSAVHAPRKRIQDLARVGDAEARPVFVRNRLDLGLDLGLGQTGQRDEIGRRRLALAFAEYVD
jgi:hypothetical protein